MIELKIDITDLQDLKSENNVAVIESIATTAKEVIEKGGRVVLKRSYSNAPDKIFTEYRAAKEFESYWNDLFSKKSA